MKSVYKVIIGGVVIFLIVASIVIYKKKQGTLLPDGQTTYDLANPDGEEDNNQRVPADPNAEFDLNSVYKG